VSENFNVDEPYYFEEIETPDADRMLYAISLSQGVKVFLIDTRNVYMDNISREMINGPLKTINIFYTQAIKL
jgi:hypothetical protein